jgi:predicted ATPase
LLALERAGLVYAESRAHATNYVFKHALVQEVAYQSLLRSRRRELHLRIAETLESPFRRQRAMPPAGRASLD